MHFNSLSFVYCILFLVECTTGTYHNIETGVCTPCLKGTFQDTTAQDHCKQCQDGFTTEQEGAKSESYCYGMSLVEINNQQN